jgi:hypothetical protein
LTTFQGQNVDISKFYSDKPLLLMFFGGSWWPFCCSQMYVNAEWDGIYFSETWM